MSRSKSSTAIRDDALKVARSKLAAGCRQCADAYLELARAHGATEDQIQHALSAVDEQGSVGGISRRKFLSSAAASAGGIAALAAVGGIVRELEPRPAAAAAPDGSQIAWINAWNDSGQRTLLGIDPAGQSVGTINPIDGTVLRTSDGKTILTVGVQQNGAQSVTAVKTYDCASGKSRSTITGQLIPLGHSRGFDETYPDVSSDGQFLGVLHVTNYVEQPNFQQIEKVGIDGVTASLTIDKISQKTSLEVIDLTRGTSLGSVSLHLDSSIIRGGHVQFVPGQNSLLLFTVDNRFAGAVFLVAFDSASIRLLSRAKDGDPGHRVPAIGPNERDRIRGLSPTQPLVRLDPGNGVQWFNGTNLTLESELRLDFGSPGAKGFSVTPVFSPDNSTLYAVRADTGTVQAVDLRGKSITGHATLADPLVTGPAPGARFVSDTQAAVLSQDGSHLLVCDAKEGGVLSLDVPALTFVGHSLDQQRVRALWSEPNGDSIFGSGGEGGVLYVFTLLGKLRAVIQTHLQLGDFLTSA